MNADEPTVIGPNGVERPDPADVRCQVFLREWGKIVGWDIPDRPSVEDIRRTQDALRRLGEKWDMPEYFTKSPPIRFVEPVSTTSGQIARMIETGADYRSAIVSTRHVVLEGTLPDGLTTDDLFPGGRK